MELTLTKIYLAFLVLVSCNTSSKKQSKNNITDISQLIGYKVEAKEIIYQYYEKYGFTDLCIHNRTYFVKENFKVNEQWKRMPLNELDIVRLNSIEEKVDTIQKGNITYEYKSFFEDIKIKSTEYRKDTVFKNQLDLKNSYYKISDYSFEIYNPKNKTIYFEYHFCNE